jgi:ABC-type sugar transport system ATPase subunit
MSTPLLEIKGLSKTFPGLRALNDVSLTIGRGEIVALVGQNGSGKSTLVKILAGFHDADPGGQVLLHGRDGSVLEGNDAREALRFVHQDLALIGLLNTIENLDLPRVLGSDAFKPVRTAAEAKHATQMLAQMGARIDVLAPVSTLTTGERAIVAIARALGDWTHSDTLLVLDEPTASLHKDEVARLMAAVKRLAAREAGILFISHSLEEVLSLADRIVVLRDGTVVEDRSRGEFDHDELVAAIAGEIIARGSQRKSERHGEVKLSARGLSGFSIDNVDLELRAGEIVGVTGILGSGREQLASLLFGAIQRTGGEVRIGDKALPSGNPTAAIEAGVALVPADRARHGVVMTMSARENLTLPSFASLLGRLWNVRRRAERDEARKWAANVDLRPPDPERMLTTLSGGNQQKIVMAKWLRNKPAVLLLDEPTQGVDVGAKATLHRIIADAAAAGTAVLICSTDTEELADLADRVIVMRDGRISGEIAHEDLTEARLIGESQGRSAPPPIPANGAVGGSHG